MALHKRGSCLTWTSYADATIAELEARLGADHVAWIRGRQNPAGYARSRATGWWDANDLELESAYRRLAALLDAELEACAAQAALLWSAREARQ